MPKNTNKKEKRSLLSDTWTGYSIIIVHLFFVVGLATAIIFVQALADYIEYVIAGGALLILGSTLFFYRKFRKNGRQLVKTLRETSAQYSQDIKIDFLGGLASISINNHDQERRLPLGLAPEEENGARVVQALPQAVSDLADRRDPQSELLRLADLLDRHLINKKEFELFKKALLSNQEKTDS